MNHRDVSALLPWFVNGTLNESDRLGVDEHVRVCALCREDLALETSVYQGMAADGGVQYMPASSLKILQSKVEQFDAERDPSAPLRLERVAPAGRPARWRLAWAASIVAAVSGAVLLTLDRSQAPMRVAAVYHTVTNSDARSPREVIRAVFSPSITLVELQAILDEAQLGIISGPTEAGVYSLAAKSDRPVSASLALLRQHATVRFAESTRANPANGGSL